MKLSRLVYLCIKNVNYYDDDSFTYEHFITEGIKEANNYSDYSVSIHNVFTPLNEAIQRLSDLERIPYKIAGYLASDLDNKCVVDLSKLKDEEGNSVNVKEVINIVTSNYERLPFTPFGVNKVRILRYSLFPSISVFGEDISKKNLLVEYKEEIPTFDENETFPTITDNDGDFEFDDATETIAEEVELSKYGINNAMCQYIIEYVQGKLEEQIDAALATMHLTRAEQYFTNLKPVISAFCQEQVHKKYTIE